MSASRSKSSSKTHSYAQEQSVDGEDVINVNQTSAPVTIDRSGIQTSGLVEIISQIGAGAGELTAQVLSSQAQTNRALENVAQHASGAQTEVGRVIDKLAMPVVFLLAGLLAIVALGLWGKRRRA